MSTDDARGVGEVLYDARRSAPYDRNGWDTLSSNSQRFWCEQAEQVLASPQFARLIAEAEARGAGRVREAVEGVCAEIEDLGIRWGTFIAGAGQRAVAYQRCAAMVRAALGDGGEGQG